MYRFFVDAIAVLRLRFFNTTHYHYPFTVVMAIIITISMLNTAVMAPLFGSSIGIMCFWILTNCMKWLLLSWVMRLYLTQSNQSPQNWRGYVLLTDALVLPMIVSLYWPLQLNLFSLLWQFWIMLVQFIGFVRLSQASGFRVVGAYLIYGVLAIILYSLIIAWFNLAGWIDLTAIDNQLKQLFNQIATQPQ